MNQTLRMQRDRRGGRPTSRAAYTEDVPDYREFWERPFPTIPPEGLALLSTAEQQTYEQALRRWVALQSPLDFANTVSKSTQEYAAVRLVNSIIVALVEDRLYKSGVGPSAVYDDAQELWVHPETGERVMDQFFLTEPPRHGKSYLISEHTPAWYEARHPERTVIFASYEATFAEKYGRRNRDHLLDPQNAALLQIQLNKDVQSQGNWETAAKGGMMSVGAGGAITGKGFHLGIVDDPIKNDEEAFSETDRAKKKEWWAGTFYTRREPIYDSQGRKHSAKIILVHTRWHEDDLGGHLMSEEGHLWFFLNLPALQPDNEDGLQETALFSGTRNPLCRAAGEALVPQRFTARELRDTEAKNARVFRSLYQGNPFTDGAGVFSRAKAHYWRPGDSATAGRAPATYVLHRPEHPTRPFQAVSAAACFHFITADLACSLKTRADYTVFSTWALTPDNDLLLVDRLKERIESADHFERLLGYLEQLRRWGITVRRIGVEKATYGASLIKLARRRKLPVRPLDPDKDKFTRALPAGDAQAGGWLFWPGASPWLEDWEDEHVAFPDGAHDDQVDTTAYAVHQVLHGGLTYRRSAAGPEPVGLQERLDAQFVAEMTSGRRRFKKHPELGRI